MVLVVERDECSEQGAGSQLPVAPEQPSVLGAPPEQGVEPETTTPPDQGVELETTAPPDQGMEPEKPVGPDHNSKLGGCDKPSSEASV